MVINKPEPLLGLISEALLSYFRMNKIEMEENIAVHIIVTDSNSQENETPMYKTFIGFSDQEEIHRDLVAQEFDKGHEGAGLILPNDIKN